MADDDQPDCRVFRAGETYAGKQGFDLRRRHLGGERRRAAASA